MRLKQAPGTVSLAEALQGNPSLGALLGRWREAQQCMHVAAPILGPDLSASMRPGPVQDGQWTLLAASGGAAAKSRQLLPRITQAVQALGLGVQTVRVRVLPPAQRHR